jgi:ABC-type multidrug transport system fused ATPase/permease subunit
MIMTFVPRAVIAYSGFDRIQAYLLKGDNINQPLETIKMPGNRSVEETSTFAVELAGVSIPGTDGSRPILRDISFSIHQGSLVICTGPVGSGKTTLARAILGEIPSSQGYITVSPERIAYCSQLPWLPSQVIRDVICGPIGPHGQDESWYQKTIKACCLDSDFKALLDGDLTPVGSKGMNLSGGQRHRIALARAIYSRCQTVILDDSLSALDEKTQSQVVENLLQPGGILRDRTTTVVWITTSTKFFNLADEIIVLADGVLKERGTWVHLRENDPLIDQIIHPHLETPVAFPEARTTANKARTESPRDGSKDLARRNGDLSLYKYYLKSAGLGSIGAMSLAGLLYSFFNTYTQYWLKMWTDSGSTNTTLYMTGYMLLLVLAYVSTVTGMFYTNLRIAPNSGLALHSRLLVAITSAPLRYFSGTDSGTILNRFGQDIQLVDKQLAPALQSLNNQVFKLLNQACVLLASQPMMALSLPYSAAIVYIVQKVYLRTSRQLRLLELESRAAIFSCFLESIQGAPTIRAFGWGREFARQNVATLDNSQRPFYLLLCLQRWLNVVLNLLIAAIAVGTIGLAVLYRDSTTGGQIGMALNVILVANTTLLSLVGAWTDLEISLGAVARLKEAETETPREDQPDECDLPPRGWPSRGDVVLSGVTAAYSPSAIALRGIDLRVEAGQMVIVCGRTGSGKSSLLLSLLRLLDNTKGSITVDGVELSSLPRSLVRGGAFITVAQEALFLPQASLRFNLDPELKAPRSVITAALRLTGLWNLLDDAGSYNQENTTLGEEEDSEETGVLDKPFSSLPILSAGQIQLLALSRALIRRSVLSGPATAAEHYTDFDRIGSRPIVLLDEVTSSLDPVTEGKLLDLVREEFVDQGHTVIMVTHKLDAVRGRMREGRDAVLWMGQGWVERVEVA